MLCPSTMTIASNLELTISVAGFPSSPSRHCSGIITRHDCRVKLDFPLSDLDMNQMPQYDHAWATNGIEEEDESFVKGVPPRKKLRLSTEQSHLLEESFQQHHTLNPRQKEQLAAQLKLMPRQVEVWFQNRRARSKLKQTEMECEYLKRCFGSLTEQNKRLLREVEELRAIKVRPPTIIPREGCEPLPASALTMCPRCEKVTANTAGMNSLVWKNFSDTPTANKPLR